MSWSFLKRSRSGRGKGKPAARWQKPMQRKLRLEPLESRQLLSGDFFVVPGTLGADVAVEFHWVSRDAKFDNEIGVFKVSNSAGTVAGQAPGSASYGVAALGAGQTVFASGQGTGASQVLTFKGGDRLAFFLVQDGTRQAAFASLLSQGKGPNVFFSTDGVNADGVDHCLATSSGAGLQVAFEDQTGGGDQDFNDAIISVGPAGLFVAPGGTGQRVEVSASLRSRESAYANEIGLFLVDDVRGAIGGLLPGSEGYAAAALNSPSRRVLFRGDVDAGPAVPVSLSSGQYFAFYLTPNSTPEEILRTNPRNLATQTPHAFFSIAAANPDGKAHVRASADGKLGFEDLCGGGDCDFNDAVIAVSFGTPVGVVTPPDTTRPTVTAALANDTADAARAATATDRVTADPTVSGTVADNVRVVQLLAGFDNQATSAYRDVTAYVDTAGAFRLDRTKIDTIYGAALTAGAHTLRLLAKDAAGNTTQFELPFVYDVSHVAALALDANSDTGTKGEFRTDTTSVTLTGTAEALATVRLVRIEANRSQTTLATTAADATGAYRFNGVTLAGGPNGLKVFATDAAGNVAETGATLTLNRAPTVSQPLATVEVDLNAPESVIDLANVFADADSGNAVVRVTTVLGVFDIQLFNSRTPGHAANFLAYANAGDYDDTFIHRVVSGFIVQGGGFEYRAGQSPNYAAVTDRAAVTNEPGLPNSKGTVALAKLPPESGAPDPVNSGTNEWFVNLADNVANLDNQNGGFTVFGQVLGNGQQVVNAIAAVPRYNLTSLFNSIPLRNFTGSQIQQATADNFVLVTDVARVQNPLTYSVVGNSYVPLVTASIAGNGLRLQYAPGQQGTATITIRATDTDGSTVDMPVIVNVADRNTAPTTTGLADVNVDEDAADTIVNLWPAFADAQTPDAGLTYTVAGNTNADLFSDVRIDAATGQLTLDYAPDAFGTAQLTIRATDPAGRFVETPLNVNVAAVNDAPMVVAPIPTVNVVQNTAQTTIDLNSVFADVDNSNAQLTYEVTNISNSALFTSVEIDSISRQLTLRYAADTIGISTVTVKVTDPGGLFTETSFTIVVDTPR